MSVSPYIVGPSAGHAHTHTIIFLHGRDSQAQEFASELFECEASGSEADRTLPALFPTVRWVFPQAAALRSERFGVEMSQWFDMWSVENAEERIELQVPGLLSSVASIRALVKEEELLVPRKSIFLGGISQGFATAIATFFADGSGGFAGLCGFCSWLPLADKAALNMAKQGLNQRQHMRQLYANSDDEQHEKPSQLQLIPTPILLEHCQDDEVVPIGNGARMRELLSRLGLSVEWHDYEDGGHWINEPQGVDDFVRFLQANLYRADVS
ncbi:Phospholipase/carboxylesterase [Trichoderma citrinoviride]|uniref:Phospholipase/carboxylesterase n=1 Tax=Trichoderma citrinoviride TaxID=58853 RepID=A0A2T4AZ96_9HYPO|nr:Phospholipase/carboxylesterase [Trichoderma citrinoviride]PTB62301.1 Phospholipase/carboxylesterase [Trichoderma citrinoviride]